MPYFEAIHEGGFLFIGCRKRRVVHTIREAGAGPGVNYVRCVGGCRKCR